MWLAGFFTCLSAWFDVRLHALSSDREGEEQMCATHAAQSYRRFNGTKQNDRTNART